MIRALLLTTLSLVATGCGGHDDSTIDMKCGAITCASGTVADVTTCSCKPAPDASVPRDLSTAD